jgi:hypothetical protein
MSGDKIELKWQNEGEVEPSGRKMLVNAIDWAIDYNQYEEESPHVAVYSSQLSMFAVFVKSLDKHVVDLVIDSLTDEYVDCRTP